MKKKITEAPPDDINHPTHYVKHPSGVECWTIVEHMSFNIGNAMKYLWRAGYKTHHKYDNKSWHIQDMRKAIAYIEREIKKVESE